MPVTISCPDCSAGLSIKDESLGKRVRCPKCSKVFTAEAPPEVDDAPIEVVADDLPKTRRPAKRSRYAEDGDSDPDIDVRRKPPTQSPLYGILLAVAVCGILGGGVLFFLGMQKRTIRNLGSEMIQDISAADLSRNGPGKNVNVRMRGFSLGPNYIYEKKNNSWTSVWIPVFPEGSDQNGDIKVLVKSNSLKNENQVNTFYTKQSIDGVITNAIHSLGTEEKKHLKQSYPRASVDSVWILDVDYDFPKAGTVQTMILLGIVLLVVGLCSGGGCLYLHFTGRSIRR